MIIPTARQTYDRLGRQKTVTDAVGTRTFAYSNALQLESESIDGSKVGPKASSGKAGENTGGKEFKNTEKYCS